MNGPRPHQVTSGGVMITFFPDRCQFVIGLRERETSDGLILPSRQITVSPARIAGGEDPSGFADMLERAAREIRNLLK